MKNQVILLFLSFLGQNIFAQINDSNNAIPEAVFANAILKDEFKIGFYKAKSKKPYEAQKLQRVSNIKLVCPEVVFIPTWKYTLRMPRPADELTIDDAFFPMFNSEWCVIFEKTEKGYSFSREHEHAAIICTHFPNETIPEGLKIQGKAVVDDLQKIVLVSELYKNKWSVLEVVLAQTASELETDFVKEVVNHLLFLIKIEQMSEHFEPLFFYAWEPIAIKK